MAGFSFFTCFFAVFLGFSFLSIAFPFARLETLNKLIFVFPPALQLVWLISTAILVGFIFSGIYILQLREFGRALLVYLLTIDIPHLIVGKGIYNNYHFEPIYFRNHSFIVIGLIINALLIYFFNHTKISRQFK